MKWLVTKIYFTFLFCSLLLCLGHRSLSANNLYIKDSTSLETTTNKYHKLIPDQAKVHFAGSIGIVSLGTGWTYGKRKHWESDLLFGYLSSNNDDFIASFTIKQSYSFKNLKLYKNCSFEPIISGLFFNYITDDHLWLTLPDRYPKKYYSLPTSLRTHAFIGQRINFATHNKNKVSFYYEFNINDLYLVSAIQNSDLTLSDIAKFSFGLKIGM